MLIYSLGNAIIETTAIGHHLQFCRTYRLVVLHLRLLDSQWNHRTVRGRLYIYIDLVDLALDTQTAPYHPSLADILSEYRKMRRKAEKCQHIQLILFIYEYVVKQDICCHKWWLHMNKHLWRIINSLNRRSRCAPLKCNSLTKPDCYTIYCPYCEFFVKMYALS